MLILYKTRQRFGKVDHRVAKLRSDLRLQSQRLQEMQEQNTASILKALNSHRKTMANDALELGYLQSINSSFEFAYPVFFGAWAVDGYSARAIIDNIERLRPQVILELGSGSSTVITAATLKKLGLNKTRHIAVDHKSEFLEITRRNLQLQGLENRVELWHCPLSDAQGDEPPWYSGIPEKLLKTSVDLMLVDGPPGALHPHARRPAMDVLYDNLSEGAVVLLDDAARNLEREIVAEWKARFPNLSVRFFDRGKGYAEITRVKPTEN